MKSIVLVALVAGWLWHPTPVEAQEPSAPAKPHGCFRGRPLPHCSSFWITEFGIGARLSSDRSAGGPLFGWELGGMKNQGRKNAFGAALFVEASGEGGGLGVRPRYRRWLDPA